jgi:hypothetical protein
MAKKLSERWGAKFHKKFHFLHLAKNLQCIFQIKNEKFLIFLILLDSYSESFMQKKKRPEFDSNHPGNEEKQWLTFVTALFYCDIL